MKGLRDEQSLNAAPEGTYIKDGYGREYVKYKGQWFRKYGDTGIDEREGMSSHDLPYTTYIFVSGILSQNPDEAYERGYRAAQMDCFSYASRVVMKEFMAGKLGGENEGAAKIMNWINRKMSKPVPEEDDA